MYVVLSARERKKSQLGKGLELGFICLLRELDFSLNFFICDFLNTA